MFPSPCDSHHASMVWCLHIYFRMISVPDGPLLSSGSCGRLWRAPGLNSICNSERWPAEGAFLPAAAQVLFQAPFENHPSDLSPHLEDVGLSWDWVVDTIDGEDNRGQDIDCKT